MRRVVTGMRFAAALAVAGCLVLARPASAQVESREGIALQNQIFELRHELDSLRGQLESGGGSNLGNRYPAAPPEAAAQLPGDLTARLLTRVAALEDQVRTLTGRVDELANQAKRQDETLTKQIGDLNFRLQTLEGGGSHAAPPSRRSEATRTEQPAATPRTAERRSRPPSTLGAMPLVPPLQRAPYATGSPRYPAEAANGALPLLPPAEPAEQSPDVMAPAAGGALPLLPPASSPETSRAATPPRAAATMLREVRAALGRRDYAAAETAARDVLSGGTKRHAAEAHYLLARALSGQRNYARAAVSYDEAYKSSPTGPFAEPALLGMASSLANLHAKPAACAALDKLKTEFLTQRASIREAATALRRREGCSP